jgi:cobalt/nickel transport system permease protein
MRILSPRESAIAVARLDPRGRVLAALLMTFLVVLLDRWTALGAALMAALVIAGAARAFNRLTLRRLTELNLFTLFLLVFTPLSMPGEPLLQFGPLQWSNDGFLFALRVGIKANLVMLFCGALLAAMEPVDLAHALDRLGLPSKLSHALFFCVRYLESLHVEYHRLRNAMRLRAFRPRCSRHALRSLGYLVGMLFVRGIDRSDRVLEAMKCRGFDGRLHSLAAFHAGRRDAIFGVAVVSAACMIGALEWVI